MIRLYDIVTKTLETVDQPELRNLLFQFKDKYHALSMQRVEEDSNQVAREKMFRCLKGFGVDRMDVTYAVSRLSDTMFAENVSLTELCKQLDPTNAPSVKSAYMIDENLKLPRYIEFMGHYLFVQPTNEQQQLDHARVFWIAHLTHWRLRRLLFEFILLPENTDPRLRSFRVFLYKDERQMLLDIFHQWLLVYGVFYKSYASFIEDDKRSNYAIISGYVKDDKEWLDALETKDEPTILRKMIVSDNGDFLKLLPSLNARAKFMLQWIFK